MNRLPRKKKCVACKTVFEPARSLQKVCSPKCAADFAATQKAQKLARANKVERKSLREALEKAKTRGTHLKELQAAFNEWIRFRDTDRPCISCGRYHKGQWHAGHYQGVGREPALRFEPDNVHKQCKPCNTDLSGNLIRYRINLIKRIGIERVERLEGPHLPQKLTIPEIVEMKALYRAKVREMKKATTIELEAA